MTHGRIFLLPLVALAFLAVTYVNEAKSALFEISFSGTVVSVDAGVSGTFNTTQTLSGSYIFESTIAANAGGNSNFAVFDALTDFSFSIGGYTASSNAAAEIQVDNAPGAPNDRYGITSRASQGLTGADVGGLALDFFGLRLDDSSNSVFSDALILPTALSLLDFDSTGFFVSFGPINTPSVVSGTIDKLSVTAVPLPAALPLLAGGVGLLGLLGWRRKRAAA